MIVALAATDLPLFQVKWIMSPLITYSICFGFSNINSETGFPYPELIAEVGLFANPPAIKVVKVDKTATVFNALFSILIFLRNFNII